MHVLCHVYAAYNHRYSSVVSLPVSMWFIQITLGASRDRYITTLAFHCGRQLNNRSSQINGLYKYVTRIDIYRLVSIESPDYGTPFPFTPLGKQLVNECDTIPGLNGIKQMLKE